jgi:hypothetical protein
LFPLLFRSAGDELVKRVVRAFAGGVSNDARLFEQVRLHARAPDSAARVEAHLHELAETARVVVAFRFRVPKRLERGVRRKQHRLHRIEQTLFLRSFRRGGFRTGNTAAEFRQAPQRDLRGFGFARAGFARHDERLVFFIREHVAVRVCDDFIHVRVCSVLGRV